MIEQNIKQFWFEFECWKRALLHLQSENVYLKNRLAHITKDEFTNDILSDIEYYHAILIAEDNTIALLRNDISSQETWLKREIVQKKSDLKEVLKSQKNYEERLKPVNKNSIS